MAEMEPLLPLVLQKDFSKVMTEMTVNTVKNKIKKIHKKFMKSQ
jgi:hypothetical protein